MSRIPQVNPAATTPERQVLLSAIHQAFGATPAMFKTVAQSPAALQMMWGAFGALGGGVIAPKLGEQIAVAVADRNACEYCLAAHTALGRKAGASAAEMAAAQAGESTDPKTNAALRFAQCHGDVGAGGHSVFRRQGGELWFFAATGSHELARGDRDFVRSLGRLHEPDDRGFDFARTDSHALK